MTIHVRVFTSLSLLLAAQHLSGCGDCGVTVGETASDGSQHEPEPDPDFADMPPGIYNFVCENFGVPVGATLVRNWYTNGWNQQVYDNLFNACADVDPANSNWEDLARAACTRRCENIAHYSYLCEDENWNDVYPYSFGGFQTCPKAEAINIDVIEDILGLTAAQDIQELPCELWDDCELEFDPDVIKTLWSPITTSTRWAADRHAATTSTDPAVLSFLGAGQTTPTTHNVSGEASFTASSCGTNVGACPFYLSHLKLTQSAAAAWSVTTQVPNGVTGPVTVTKQLSGMQLSLVQPAMAIVLPASGDVVFPPNSLRVRLQATVGGTTNGFGENGSYDEVYSNAAYIFGEVTSTSLLLSVPVDSPVGSGALDVEFENLPM